MDWDRFDLIGVDHYRDTRIKDRYAEMLQPLLATGKPVINTEFGMRTYRGAESEGTLGFGVADVKRIVLHQILPFVRERLSGDYIRDEAMQASELIETLTALDAAGVDGAFVAEFVTAGATFSEQPRYDPRHERLRPRQDLPARQRNDLPGHELGAQAVLPHRRRLLRQPLALNMTAPPFRLILAPINNEARQDDDHAPGREGSRRPRLTQASRASADL